MRKGTREQISDTARELINGISELVYESCTADLICHIEVQMDDLMDLQIEQAYWMPIGQSRRDWGQHVFRTHLPLLTI